MAVMTRSLVNRIICTPLESSVLIEERVREPATFSYWNKGLGWMTSLGVKGLLWFADLEVSFMIGRPHWFGLATGACYVQELPVKQMFPHGREP